MRTSSQNRGRSGRRFIAGLSALSLALGGLILGPLGTAPARADFNVYDPALQAIDADAIEHGYVRKVTDITSALEDYGQHTISGHVYVISGGGLSSGDGTSTQDMRGPNGTRVYAQWKDKDGWVSPVYTAVAHDLPGEAGQGGQGTYAFRFPFVTDHFGTVHKYNAVIGQEYKVWTEPQKRNFDGPAANTNTDNMLIPLKYGGAMADKWTGAATAGGSFQFAGQNTQRVGLWMQELPSESITGSPNYLKASKPVEDTRGPIDNPSGIATDAADRSSISGKVYYETGWKFGEMGTTNVHVGGDPGAPGYKVFVSTLTNEGRKVAEQTMQLPREQRAAEFKREFSARPELIQGTYFATTDPDGNFTVRTNDTLDRNYFYMWVESPDGQFEPAFSNFVTPGFYGYNHNNWWQPHAGLVTDTGFWGALLANANRVHNMNFGIKPFLPIKLDLTQTPEQSKTQVIDKLRYPDADKVPVYQGDTIGIDLNGVVSPLGANIVVEGPSQASLAPGCQNITDIKQAIKDCTITFADDATPGIYNVILRSGLSDNVDQHSVAVIKKVYPRYDYDPTELPSVQGGEVKAPQIINKMPEVTGTTFTPGAGFPKWATLNVDGSITVNKDVTAGDYELPVVVTIPDQTLSDGTVLPGTSYEIKAKITITPPMKDTYEPTYSPQDGKPGETKTFEPKNPDGTKFNPPTGTVCSVTGTGVTVDATTCVVTVTVPSDKKDGDKVTHQVTIKYPDGSEETKPVVVKVTVDSDGDDVNDSDDRCPTIPGPVGNEGCPDWKDTNTVPNKPVEITPDLNGKDWPAGADVKVEKVEGPGNAVLDPQTGVLTVIPKPEAKVGDKIVVTITDGNGNPVDTVTVEIREDPDNDKVPSPVDPTKPQPGDDKCPTVPGPTSNEGCPDWEDTITEPNTPVEIIPNTGDQEWPPNTTYPIEVDGPGDAKIDPNTGVITVTPKDDAKIGDKIVVTIKDPNTGDPIDTVTVEIREDPDNDKVPSPVDPTKPQPGDDKCPTVPGPTSNEGCPDWEDTITEPNTPVEIIPNTGDQEWPPNTTYPIEVDGPGDAKIDPNTGVITVTPKDDAKIGDKIVVTIKDPNTGDPIDTVTVEIREDPDKDKVPSPVDPTKPQPGDDKCPTVPGPKSNEGCPDWQDDATVPNVPVEIKPDTAGQDWPNEDPKYTVEVTQGPGTATIDPTTGVITVTPKPEAKIGDVIVVTVKDNDGNQIDQIIVTIRPDTDGDKKPDPVDPNNPKGNEDHCPTIPGPASNNGCPDWDDSETVPTKPIVIKPNTGDQDWPKDVKVEIVTEGPGDASIDPNTGEITVVPNPNNPGGGTITVTVKDPTTDQVIDVIEVIVKPDEDGDGVADDKDKCPGTPAGAKVDENGCSVHPNIGDPNKEVTGEVNKPIDPIVIPIDNPGQQEIISCFVEGLPAGLTARLNDEKTACIIEGTPTESFNGKVAVGVVSKNENGQEVITKREAAVSIKIRLKGKGLPITGAEGAQGALAVAALLSVVAAGALLRRKED